MERKLQGGRGDATRNVDGERKKKEKKSKMEEFEKEETTGITCWRTMIKRRKKETEKKRVL